MWRVEYGLGRGLKGEKSSIEYRDREDVKFGFAVIGDEIKIKNLN